MTLLEYLQAEGLSQAALARELGVTRSAVNQWLRWRAVPAASTALAIIRRSGGQVTLAELVEPQSSRTG
jgi:DNA-binding transcriptional regulator YdaS (Cro superfamily)